MKSKTPMLEKMQAVKHQSQAIGEFLEWLRSEKRWELCDRHEHHKDCYRNGDTESRPVCGAYNDQLFPVTFSIEKLLAEYFGIDLQKADEEKRALLDSLQKPAMA